MNARILMIAASLALGSVTAQANPFEGDQAIAAKTAAASAVSRADVQAQLADAQKNHTMVVQGDKVAVNAYEMGKGELSRAAVVQAAHNAMLNDSIVDGE